MPDNINTDFNNPVGSLSNLNPTIGNLEPYDLLTPLSVNNSTAVGSSLDVSNLDAVALSISDSAINIEPLTASPSTSEPNIVSISPLSQNDLTPVDPLLGSAIGVNVNPTFDLGIATVGTTGKVSFEYLFDGGGYQGEVAIANWAGLDRFAFGSNDFILEAASRALSNSELGYVVIRDQIEGAKFSGVLGEQDRNFGEYLGVKTFDMLPGSQFVLMLVPNGTVQQVFNTLSNNRQLPAAKLPLFSLATANPLDNFQVGQIAALTEGSNAFVFEDLRVDQGTDGDYNDVIVQMSGATIPLFSLDKLLDDGMMNPAKDWRGTAKGQELLSYVAEVNSVAPNPDPVDVNPVLPEFPKENQPLIGIIDTGFSGNNPDIDYSRIILGRDLVDNDANPLLTAGEGNEHGTHILGIIGATQNNDLGIDGINNTAPIWIGRGIGAGKWAESLHEFVDTAKASGQPNGVINLSLDLTQVNPDGSITTRYELTPEEREALEYARQNRVVIVTAAGNDGNIMSVLGQASQEFDNIITVGAADGLDRAAYSSYGYGLDILAPGGTTEYPVLSTTGDGVGTMAGTSVAAAKVTGAVSQVWAANPELNYRQVIEVLKSTATDLKTPGWDRSTGAGLLNLFGAVELAKSTTPEVYNPAPFLIPTTWGGEGKVIATERATSRDSVINNGGWYADYYYGDFGSWAGNGEFPEQESWGRLQKLWGANDSPLGSNNHDFSIHFSGKRYLEAGWYRFFIDADDRSRVRVNGQTIIDAWFNGSGWQQSRNDFYSNGGYYNIDVDYKEDGGAAAVILDWVKVSDNKDSVLNNGGWWADYYQGDFRKYVTSGAFPDQQPWSRIAKNWGSQSGVVALRDDFSVHLSGKRYLEPGRYRFQVNADDRSRVRVNGQTIIDAWYPGSGQKEGYFDSTGGYYNIDVDYKEDGYDAAITLDWEKITTTPTPETISTNQTINRTLSSSDPQNPLRSGKFYDDYRLTGVSPGQEIRVNLNSSNFDTYLQLVNAATGQLITSDDDSGGNGNSQLTFTAQSGINYLLRATSYSDGQTGNYTITTANIAPPVETITLNQTLNRTLSSSDPQNPLRSGKFYDDYRLTGVSPGQEIRVNLNSSNFDAYLQLVNAATGQLITSDDDSGGNGNSQLTFTAQSGINYLLRATSYSDGQTGNYTITTANAVPQIPTNHWKAEYFNNRNLSGNPVYVEDWGDGSQNFERNWGLGSPQNTPSDNFSARLTTQRYFPPGKYQVKINGDDGVRVKIGNQTIVDKWQDQGWENYHVGYFYSNGGEYPVTVEYYENSGAAAVKLDIQPFGSIEEPPSNGSEWNSTFFWWDRGQGNAPSTRFYENNNNRIGVVSLGSNQRSDKQNGIQQNWGAGSPEGDLRLPSDFFAVRSYTHAYFEQGKTYRIRVRADDGFQLLAKHHWLPDNDPNKWVYITPQDQWQTAYGAYKDVDFTVPNSGMYDLHFHLYEEGGDSYIDLAWGEKIGNFMVSGNFYEAYNNRREIGNPTGDVFDMGNGTLKQNFEHGYIFWNGREAEVYQTGSGTPSQPSNSFQTGQVNSRVGNVSLRLRNQPSTIGTSTLDFLSQGTTFKIIQQVSSSDPNWPSWYEVEANGKHGYVAAYYVDVISNNNSNNTAKPTPQPVITSDFSGTVMSAGINIRSGPGVNNQQVGYLSPGTPLIFDGWTRGTSHQDGITNQWDDKWFRIKNTNTWVASAYIIGNPNSNTPYINVPANQGSQPNPTPNPQPQPQPISGMPDFNLPAYRQDNLFWRGGFAPTSTNPPFTNLGNAKGNCTWYVNGRLQQLGYNSSILAKLTSDANKWDDQARAAGIRMSNTPQVGAIAQWESGHVAVVERVNSDGTIVISESSYSPVSGSSYDYLYNTRTISAGSPSTYIYVPRNGSSGSSSGSGNGQNLSPYISITSTSDAADGDSFVTPGGTIRIRGKAKNAQNVRFYLGNTLLTQGSIDFLDDDFSGTLRIPGNVAPGNYRLKALVNSNYGDADALGSVISVVSGSPNSELVIDPAGTVISEKLEEINRQIANTPGWDLGTKIGLEQSRNVLQNELDKAINTAPEGKFSVKLHPVGEPNGQIIPGVPTTIVIHGWKNDPESVENGMGIKNLSHAAQDNQNIVGQALVVDWGEGAKTDNYLRVAALRIKTVAKAVANLIVNHGLDPAKLNLVGHSLGAYVAVETALELKNQRIGGINTITLLDPATRVGFVGNSYQQPTLSDLDKDGYSTFVRAFYSSLLGDDTFSKSADESYDVDFDMLGLETGKEHGAAVELYANMIKATSSAQSNSIAKISRLFTPGQKDISSTILQKSNGQNFTGKLKLDKSYKPLELKNMNDEVVLKEV